MIPLTFQFIIAESETSGPRSREEVSDWLIRFLEMKLMTVDNPAVVFDVDSTLIERDSHSFKRIDPIYKVFDFCQRKNIPCHIVTARQECEEGMQELSRVMKHMNMKLSKFRSVHMRPRGTEIKAKNLERFKSSCREEIGDSGYTIIANIGDNWHDLGYLSKSLKYLDDTKSYIAFFPTQTTVSVKLPIDRLSGCNRGNLQ